MQIWKSAWWSIVFCTIINTCCAQRINDSLIAKVAKAFEEAQHLSLQKIMSPVLLPATQTREALLPCYSGMQVTVVAIFSKKPAQPYGRMLVSKHYSTSTKFDEHFFQQAGYSEALKVNYALLSVYFPPNATYKNCNTVLQVYDKKKPSNKVWLIVLTK